MYGALSAFLTATPSQEHEVLLAVVLLVIAAPLAWVCGERAFSVARPSDPLMLRVIVPNLALLVLCFNGSLESGPRSHGLLPALVAFAALALIVGALRMVRTRLARTRPVQP